MKANTRILVGAAFVAALGISTLASARVERLPQREARREAPATDAAVVVAPPTRGERVPLLPVAQAPSLLADPREAQILLVREHGPAVAGYSVVEEERLDPARIGTGHRPTVAFVNLLDEEPAAAAFTPAHRPIVQPVSIDATGR